MWGQKREMNMEMYTRCITHVPAPCLSNKVEKNCLGLTASVVGRKEPPNWATSNVEILYWKCTRVIYLHSKHCRSFIGPSLGLMQGLVMALQLFVYCSNGCDNKWSHFNWIELKYNRYSATKDTPIKSGQLHNHKRTNHLGSYDARVNGRDYHRE